MLVVGALGLVGRALIEELEARLDWDVIGLSRRKPDFLSRATFVQVDLTDRNACQRLLEGAAFRDVTHVAYAALYEKPELIAGWRDADQIATNKAMLENLLDPLVPSAAIEHMTLLQGTKAYGAHLRPMTNPGRESDPRPEGANFYWEQEDYLRPLARSAGFSFSIMRPQVVCGTAIGSPMNMIAAIGVYASIQRARGEPLRFPGGAPNVTQATDARLLARSILWAATAPGCRNETFNIANGDVLIWHTSWPTIARTFGLPLAEPRPERLAESMPRYAGLWRELVQQHNLAPYTMEQLIGSSWQFADAVFGYGGSPPNTIVSTVKASQFGFTETIDTNRMFEVQLKRLQALRILPP
jgi:nucleoside-diphosphate-sugar epimerase